MKINAVSVLLLVGLVVSLGFHVRQSARIEALERRPPSYGSRFDGPYIEKAAGLWAATVGSTPEAVMTGRYAKTIYFEDEVCIALSLVSGSLGGVPVYCFDQETLEVTRKYENVE